MYALISDLYPICRSITGDGVRDTLRRIGAQVPLAISEVPSGTKVFDWTIPREWNIRDAFIKNSRGERIVDFKRSNLHVLNYSTPVRARLSLQALKPHLFSLEHHPTWIPYRTVLLRGELGVLPQSRAVAVAGPKMSTKCASIRRSQMARSPMARSMCPERPATRCSSRTLVVQQYVKIRTKEQDITYRSSHSSRWTAECLRGTAHRRGRASLRAVHCREGRRALWGSSVRGRRSRRRPEGW